MIYLVWTLILGLIIFSYLNSKIPLWLPLVIYFVAVSVRVNEKIGNHRDWIKKDKRDEKVELDSIAENMAGRGLAFSGIRNRTENWKKEDFEYERKKQKRKFWVELIDSLFLK